MAGKAQKWTPFFGNPHLNEPLEEDILGKDEIRSSHGVASNLTQMYFLWDSSKPWFMASGKFSFLLLHGEEGNQPKCHPAHWPSRVQGAPTEVPSLS
jgi:hypothetical protein